MLALPASAPAEVPRQTREGFTVPRTDYVFSFPRDHGSHLDYKIEWWYLVGHLFSEDGRRFGFQATFFRNAGEPLRPELAAMATPAFGDRKLYLAHMAVIDVESGRYHHEERLNREGWDARAAVTGLDTRNGNWSLRMPGSGVPPDGVLRDGGVFRPDVSAELSPERDEGHPERMRLRGGAGLEASFDLRLVPQKPLVIFGEDGVSLKGARPTSRSFYLTYTRLAVEGTLDLEGERLAVRGLGWMDHEISSGQLAPGQVGWDWTCIQLEDGREIKAFILRREDGSADPYSTLAWVGTEPSLTQVYADGFTWEAERYWTSPATGGRYPIGVRITTTDPATGERVVFRLEPLIEDAEIGGGLGGIAYWEGACRVLDANGNEVGSAYLELTGYAESISGRL